MAGNSASLSLVAPGAAGSLGANKNLIIDTTPPPAPPVFSIKRGPTPGSLRYSLEFPTNVVAGHYYYSGYQISLGAWLVPERDSLSALLPVIRFPAIVLLTAAFDSAGPRLLAAFDGAATLRVGK